MKQLMTAVAGMVLALGAFSAFAGEPGPRLVPDYDRNGVIDEADCIRAAANEPFTIWLNDDDDAAGAEVDEGKGDVNTDLHDVPGGNDEKDCEDDKVNGRCDLLDFFPVLVDVTGVDDWANYTWKLSSESVNVVFTRLNPNFAGDFHTKTVQGWDVESPLYQAAVSKLANGDVVLPDGFFTCENHYGRGVLLVEGAAFANAGGITLRGEKESGDHVEVTLDLRVKNVEDMYGWMNLRDQGSEGDRLAPRREDASGTMLDNRHFVLVHGYNTNHEEARGNAAEFYKKLWQSGSDAMFTAVEWNGNQSQIKFDELGVNFTPNYFVNVANALAAAKPFAEACKRLSGEKILVGHSLGNVLISSAIKDHGLDYTKFVMLNAEIAGKDFAADGRFAKLPRTINCYSPSDSFLEESEFDVEHCDDSREFLAAFCQEAGFWSLNAKIKTSGKAVGWVNEFIINRLELAEAEAITPEQLAYAGVIEMPAAGANPVATLENVNMEDFIGENWPVVEEGTGNGEQGIADREKEWQHSTFREVAFYHTSKFYASLAAVGKPRVIIDTDLGSSIDDLFTIDLAARMHKAGKLDLMAVMMDRPDGSNASDDPHGRGEFLKFADRYLASLGLGDLPIGVSTPLTEDRLPQHVFNPYWTLIYSNNLTSVGLMLPTNRTDEQIGALTNAVVLYRRLLEDAQPKSVVICSLGFLNNLKALMESGLNYGDDGIQSTGKELIAAKVKELRIMAGCFDPSTAPDGKDGAEYNAAGDPAGTKKVFEEWPTPVVVSTWEVGLNLWYDPKDVLADFPPGTLDPVVRAVYTYWPDRAADGINRLWDVMTVLPLFEGEALAPLSEMGGISVDEKGVTTFTPDPSSNRCYQVASSMDATAVMERIRTLCRTGNPSADTVVYGTIRTAETGNPVAEAIAVKDGRYVYVGDEAGAAAFIEDGVTKVVDHRGKGMVMPGCTDGHSHYTMLFGLVHMKGGVKFEYTDDKAMVLQKLKAASQAAKDAGKQTLFSIGWNYYTFRMGEGLTLEELDAATLGVSAVLFDSNGHSAYCNTECLKRCGIIDGAGNVLITKIDGGLLELDGNGYPTGFVQERVSGYLTRMGGIIADENIDDKVAESVVRESQELLLSTGYTIALEGWSNQLHPSKFYEAAHRLDTNGEFKIVFPMTYEVEPWQTNMTSEIDHLASLKETYGTRHVLPSYLKIFMDGCVETKTGAMVDPYQDTDHTVYKSFWATNRLADITRACNAKGLTVHTHTMGDAAIRDVTDAYIQGGDGTHRNCLVHLRNVRPEDFQRFAENNIACTAGMTWHVINGGGSDEHMVGFLDEKYIKHAYPMKSFFDAGVKVSSHTDFPANGGCPQDPFGIMQVAVTGLIPNPPDGMTPFDTDELITREQAFQALTLNGAWQMGLENERGSIKVGKWADFVLADQDVFECETSDIGKTKVVSTWFEGEKVFEASESVSVKPGEQIVRDTAEEASNVMKRAVFTPSAKVAEELGGEGSTVLQTYCNMFTLDVVPTSDGKWAVAAFLLPPDWTNVVKSAQAATLQIPVAELAAYPYGEPLKNVPLTNCVPGFYYSLYDGTAVTNLKADLNSDNCNLLCGPGATVTIPVVPHNPASGFYSIGVLEAPVVVPGKTETATMAE